MNLQISGKTSAGWASSIMTNLGGICLDMGISEQFNHGATTICLTHQHTDHVHGLDLHVVRLIESGYEGVVTIYCSHGNVNRVHDRLNFLSRKNRDQVDLIPVSPGENVISPSGYQITPFKTDHTDNDSQGYVISQSRQKLLASLQGTPGETIAYLRKKGVKVTETVVVPLVAYTGDTRATIWRKCNYEMDLARKAEILITEATYFLPDTVEEAIHRGHTHYDQLSRADLGRDDPNKGLILCHISRKYAGVDWRSPAGHTLSDFSKMCGAHFIYPNDNVHHFQS